MTIEYAALISGLSLAFAVYFGISNLNRNKKADAKQDATQMTTVLIKLENIGNNLSELKNDMSNFKLDIKEDHDRLIKVEESAKQAHKRIDEILDQRKMSHRKVGEADEER